MPLEHLHRRYLQQAQWTAELRRYLFRESGWDSPENVIEIGSGTGAVLSGLDPGPHLYGVDLDYPSLRLARLTAGQAHFSQADACRLPFGDNTFATSFCHFLLLWLDDPLAALDEMVRITRPGGSVIALAEPDYSSRIDYPQSLQPLGQWQAEALHRQGADPELGRKLAGLFASAGLEAVRSGILGAQWSGPPDGSDWELEWEVLRRDLSDQVPEKTLDRLQALDRIAWDRGERVLYVPTFYAAGRVPLNK